MKLIDIPTVCIYSDHNDKYRERKNHMDKLLNKIGFKNITFYKSPTENYPNCLTNSEISILKNNLNNEPILIIEDDVEEYIELNDTTEIIFPENTDAFYLGFSKVGGSYYHNFDDGSSVISFINNDYIKIYNMLGAHAVIYLSQRYKQKIIDELSKILDRDNYYNDVIISRIQRNYNIYGYKFPLFYQSKNLGNNEQSKNLTCFRYI